MPKTIKNKNLILQQIFSIPVEKEKYMVYAPLKGIAFIANSLIVNAIFDYCQNISAASLSTSIFSRNTDNKKKDLQNFLSFLRCINFFQPEPIPVDEYHEKGIQYDAVILFLTNRCNLRCMYCYASSGEYPKKQMNWEIAKAAIDHVTKFILNNGLNALTLGFHGGGEPTLKWNIFTRATDYAISIAKKNNILINLTGSFRDLLFSFLNFLTLDITLMNSSPNFSNLASLILFSLGYSEI